MRGALRDWLASYWCIQSTWGWMMAEPELWTAKAADMADADAIVNSWERARKAELLGLVRVSFDEAVERMVEWERKQEAVPTPATDDALRAACESALCAALNIASSDVKAGASRPNLRAALGEGS